MRKLITALLAAGVLVGVTLGQTPTPKPAPAPITPPSNPVVPPDVVPKAAITGMFWSNAQAGAQGPGTVLGMFVLDASASVSNRPIKWKVTGPQVTIIALSPSEGIASSVAQAYATLPGRYTFTAIARGIVGGEADADAAVFAFTVLDPTPVPVPVPPAPGPAPIPTPTPGPIPVPVPTPTPKPPFPSTQLDSPGRVTRRA